MLERLKRAPWSSWLPRLRTAAAAGGLIAAIWILLASVHVHYPIQHWLVWRYLQYWGFAAFFTLACLSSGFVALRLVAPSLPMLERTLLSMAVGVLLFFLGMFAGGVLGAFGSVFAIALPSALLASGAWPLFKYLRRARRHLSAFARRRRPAGFWRSLAIALGGLGLVMVYVTILVPDNAAYDARWYHLAIPEHYVAAGGIVRFEEGWFQGTLPQLASLIYVWPYQIPWLALFDHVEIAAHLEFVLFLWTLLGVPVLVRWLVPRARAPASWAAFFLFSSLFVYDSALTLAADHIAALWAIPSWLALRRAWRALEPRACLLLGAMLAGAALTKYQSVQIVLVVFSAIGLRALQLLLRPAWERVRRQPARALGSAWLLGPLCVLASFVLLTAPHWLKNWIWYGDPLYPVLHERLSLRPWHADADHFYRTLVERHFWRPTGSALEKTRATLEALFTFSFRPHDWQHFHGVWPVFGFLFTLSWPVMPFLRATRRLWLLFAATHVGLVVWFMFSHQDRYLQILMPWMVAHVAAVIALAWRMGWWVRIPLLGLLALQIVWGVGAYFVPSHVYMRNKFVRVSELLSGGYKREYAKRFRTFTDLREVGRALRPDQKILLHRFEVHAGLLRMSVTDHPSWQGLISYGRFDSHAGVFDLFRSLGVSHVAWVEDDWLAEDSLAGDLRFAGFVTHVLHDERKYGGIVVADLPDAPPSEIDDTVLYLGCKGYQPGLYELETLNVPGMAPPPEARHPDPQLPLAGAQAIAALITRANYVVTGTGCPIAAPKLPGFVHRASRRGEALWVRRVPLGARPQ
jgi:hypothetical protein